jgi:hypothetical protein
MIAFTETCYREYKIPIGDDVLTVNEAGYQAIQYLLKQAKREALLEAAGISDDYQAYTMSVGDKLRKMAEELK